MAERWNRVFRSAIAGASADDFSRVWASGARKVILSANASGGGFERASAPLARELLDACRAADARGDADAALGRVFTAAGDWAAGKGDEVCAWLTAVIVDGDMVSARWAGGDEVWHVAGGALRARTLAHTLRTPAGGEVFTRGLGAGYETTGPETLQPRWRIEPGGSLLLLGRSLARRVPESEILEAATGDEARWQALVERPELATEAYALAVKLPIPVAHYWILGHTGSEPLAEIAERVGSALGVAFAARESAFHGASQRAGDVLVGEEIVIHANRDLSDTPGEDLLSRAPDCPTIIRFRRTGRDLTAVRDTLTRALGAPVRVLVEKSGRAPQAAGTPAGRSVILGYGGTAPLAAVAKVVGDTAGLQLTRRESDAYGGGYYRAGQPGSEEIYVYQQPSRAIEIRIDGSERDLTKLVAELEQRLGVALWRLST